jgi:Fe-S-cluster containining protein
MVQRARAGTYTLRFPTIDGHVATTLRVPSGSLGLRDLVPLAQAVSAQAVKRSVQVEREQGREISCRAGCGACCRQLVPISAPEAFRLADHVLSLDEAARDRFLARIDEVDAQVAESGMLDDLLALESGMPADAAGFAARYFGQRIACPFLVDESCGVYEERPLSCRHFLVTSPAAWCAEPTLHSIRTVPMPPLLSGALSSAAAALLGEPPVMIPLSIAMRWVDAHAEQGMREWPAEEVTVALMRALGIPEEDITRAMA